MLLFLTLFGFFMAFTLIGAFVVPVAVKKVTIASEKHQHKLSNNMEGLMGQKEASQKSRLFVLAPLVLGGGLYFLFPEGFQLFGALLGAIGGLLFPGIYIQFLSKKNNEKFQTQLIDALMIMSSSFRGGLSLVQALEAVVDEMDAPITLEFATVLSENKMGVSLDEALNHLYNRMPSSALQQMITAILLARETGGNLPIIFNRIVTNIREKKKVQSNLDTLTVQGKLQGVVMSLLPLGFAFIVYQANKAMFEHMFKSPTGRGMLMYALFSEIIGAYMILKISTFKDF